MSQLVERRADKQSFIDFALNTFDNKMLQYFTETSELHVGYFQL